MNKLIAGIKSINPNGDIKAKFFLATDNDIEDVTAKLYNGINSYNESCRDELSKGRHKLIIPYRFKDGYMLYSFGCGLTHYLQDDNFEELNDYVKGFSLINAKLTVLTPSDFKMLFKKTVSDSTIESDLLNYCR